MEAYKMQMYHSLSKSKERSDICDRILKEYWFDPYASIFTEGCIEKGADIYGGGAKYYGMKEIIGTGLATATDSIAPSHGKDVKGPTCSLNSVTKIDYKGLNGATTVNLKLNPAFVKGQQGTNNLKALIKAYCTGAVKWKIEKESALCYCKLCDLGCYAPLLAGVKPD